jgi:polyisoprenoid-binding protein YceI
LITVAVAAVSPGAFAADATWSVESKTSYARFFQGSAANPNSSDIGVARVTGTVMVDSNDVSRSLFDLSIYPTDEDWGLFLSAEGNLPAGYVPAASDHTLLRFKSKRIVKAGSGELEVMGDLTVTRVERSVTADPNEAYAGPVYGEPRMNTVTREITFLFPRLSVLLSPEPPTSAMRYKNGAQGTSGSAHVVNEEFPELSKSINETNWPPVVQDERCEVPSAGEDYRGPLCTGRVIAATRVNNCDVPSAIGEDYHGLLCTPPAGGLTTVVLDLKFLRTVSESSK